LGINPVCSVIIPAYRCEAYIEDCIDSVQKQTVNALEILVIDDDSPDNMAQIVKKMALQDKRIRYIKLEKNLGAAEARNRGAFEARSEWIAFLDSDDMWFPTKIEKQLNLQKKTDAELIYTGAQCIDDNGKLLNSYFHVPNTVTYKKMLCGNDIICSSVLLRRDVFLHYTMERSDLHEDYITWLKILRNGYSAVGLQEPLVYYRLSKNSKSRCKLKSAIMTWKTYKHINIPYAARCAYFIAYTIHGIRRYWL